MLAARRGRRRRVRILPLEAHDEPLRPIDAAGRGSRWRGGWIWGLAALAAEGPGADPGGAAGGRHGRAPGVSRAPYSGGAGPQGVRALLGRDGLYVQQPEPAKSFGVSYGRWAGG